MKKIIPFLLLFTACKSANHDGKYTNHTKSDYSITDDTLEVRDTVIIEHTGFRRIRNGITQPKAFKTRQLLELQPQFDGNKLILSNTTYEKL